MSMIAVAAIAMGALFTSCKKERTCDCTYSFGGQTMTQNYKLGKVSGKTAKDACDTHQSQVSAMGTDAKCGVN